MMVYIHNGIEQAVYMTQHAHGSLPTILDNLYKILKVGQLQDGTSYKDNYLLHYLDPSVLCLPRLLTAADRLEEGEQGRNTECQGNYSKCSAK